MQEYYRVEPIDPDLRPWQRVALGALLVLPSAASMLLTVDSVLAIRAMYGSSCGTGYAAVVNDFFCAGWVLALPLSVWLGADRAGWIAAFAGRVLFLPGITWLGAFLVMSLAGRLG